MSIFSIGGVGQMTPAMQNTVRKAAAGTARAYVRKKARKSKKVRRVAKAVRKVKRVAKSAKKLVKGSAAAKAYMAKIRKMRKK